MNAFADYLAAIKKNRDHGDATEHTHRTALKSLLEAVDNGIVATNEPTRILCGAPDFNITRKKVPLGHVETKDIETNLNETERGKGPHGEQFKRYLTLPNWILTDYLEFRWFVGGEKRLTARIGEIDAKGKLKPLPDAEEKLAQLLNAFFKQKALTIGTAKELAQRMAGMTRIIRDLIVNTFEHEKEEGWLHNWLAAFRETLIPDLDEAQFADMFAQTLAYGLFAARVHTPPKKEFSREMAAYNLPKTNPFLRKLFSEIAGVDMPETIDWAVDDIVELLKHADMFEILKDFGKGTAKQDPVIHFYETFLAAYDPQMRDVRGVRYTPEPVVSYIVRSIDHLLKVRFNRPKGLADENTLILDPATGTATFHYFVIQLIYEKFGKQKGAWNGYVEKHLLNRLFGFELLMAPYAIAHLKLGMLLEQTGYRFESDQRLGIYLTNTLEEAAKRSEKLFTQWISDEANAAAKIKRDDPILVVLGNPPYANFGRMNRGQWILSLLDDYKRDLNEKKLNLDDDFIKFIRFAQWRIDKTGHGIVGFITNNTYLDGITHRRMRECLLETFNEIYVLNLHGNLRKKDTAPDGGKDENVFDIQQGVAIGLFVKLPNTKGCRVFHADLWGDREGKYKTLWELDAATTEWAEQKPSPPYFFFVPKEFLSAKEYQQYFPINEVLPVGTSAVQTKRDALFVDFEQQRLAARMSELLEEGPTTDMASKYPIALSPGWTPECLKNVKYSADCLRAYLYRPFDSRFIYYNDEVLGRSRLTVFQHLLKPNLALATLRQTVDDAFRHVFCTRAICDMNLLINHHVSDQVFPLYVYDTEKKKRGDWGKAVTMALFESSVGYETRRPNLSPAFLKALAEKLNLPQTQPHGLPKGITPEDIFHYAYAVLHSPTYRSRYAEFLKIDFPRLPVTGSLKLFRAFAGKGAELVALHLVESPKLNDFVTEFPSKGSNEVEKVQYTDKDKRVWINAGQYFGGVPKPVWEFHIGGYRVCDKWLKDRKGRKLSYEDIQHYQKIIVALNDTIRLMSDIDQLVTNAGGWPLK